MVTLDTSKLFNQLPPADLDGLRGRTEERRFPAGQNVFIEGDPGDGVYVVRNGSVQISVVLGNGERRVLSRIQPGDVFGEMSLLDHAPRSASATAEADTTVYFVPREAMVELLRRSPELSMKLVQEISGRLREFNRQYLREVLQAERVALVGRFAASIVHDLRNPLSIISVAAEMACTETSTAEGRRKALERISRQVERITELVNDILEFTRGAPAAPTFSPTDYGDFVHAVVQEFQQEVGMKSVRIEYANAPPAVSLALNPARLTRVFHNLIANAVDVMPQGGTIKLRFRTTDREVTTEVEDTGPGIAPEMADRLFEAFATHGKARGTGLGLSIARRVIEEHGGTLTARNQPGGGAILTFTLPRARAR